MVGMTKQKFSDVKFLPPGTRRGLKSLKWTQNMIQHLLPRFKCDECKVTFVRRQTYRVHLVKRHPDSEALKVLLSRPKRSPKNFSDEYHKLRHLGMGNQPSIPDKPHAWVKLPTKPAQLAVKRKYEESGATWGTLSGETTIEINPSGEMNFLQTMGQSARPSACSVLGTSMVGNVASNCFDPKFINDLKTGRPTGYESTIKPGGTLRFSCQYDGCELLIFDSKSELNVHLEEKHRAEKPENVQASPIPNQKPNDFSPEAIPTIKPHNRSQQNQRLDIPNVKEFELLSICIYQDCQAKLESPHLMLRHLRTSHQIPPLFCCICNSKFSTNNYLFNHILMRHLRSTDQKKRYFCDIMIAEGIKCQASFTKLKSLYRHKRTVHQLNNMEIFMHERDHPVDNYQVPGSVGKNWILRFSV